MLARVGSPEGVSSDASPGLDSDSTAPCPVRGGDLGPRASTACLIKDPAGLPMPLRQAGLTASMSDREKPSSSPCPSSLKTYCISRPAPPQATRYSPSLEEVLLRPEVRSGAFWREHSGHLWERQMLPLVIKLTPGELVKIEMLQTLQELQMRKGEQPGASPPHTDPFHDCLQLLGHRTISGLFAPANHPKPTSALRPARVESPVL